MLVLTALGSCRVTNPVRAAVSRFPVSLNNARVYGYVHSGPECIQQIRFLKQTQHLPEEVWPLVAPGLQPGLHDKAVHRPSNVYIVEISSNKDVRVGATCVQWNHVNRHFARFLDNPDRARKFWSLATGQTESAKQQFLETDASFKALSPGDRALLRELTLRVTDLTELRDSIGTILAELPQVLFVTHCNALLPDGKPIPSRDRFVRQLKSVLAEYRADFCDPTDLMHAFGQAAALRDEGGSLTHYTPEFEQALFADIYTRHLSGQPQLDLAG